MDERTHHYYETHGRELGATYAGIASPLRRYFLMTFPAGARVLDVGAGVGRDLAELVSEGYEAWGVEPATPFREIAGVRFPNVSARLRAGSLPDAMPSVEALGGPFDGIVCAAVLQHIPRTRLFDALFALKALLKERGRILISVPAARPDVVDSRDPYGRLFNGVTADEIELLFERAGFASVGRWEGADAFGREGHRWANLALELRTSGTSRPIDHIEAVLSTGEKKVATYKLALIRALCDIALTEPRRVTFAGDGMIRVPLDAIAARWINYYWPLFESETFLPQMNGERAAGVHRLMFTSHLEVLVDYYRDQGGLAAFAAARRAETMPAEAAALHTALTRSLRQAIRTGPVTHAGGSLPQRMFKARGPDVLVSAPLWRELSLTGHWIQDALLLRWANLVRRLSRDDVRIEVVMASLMVSPESGRDTSAAREIYRGQQSLQCVWTGQTLSKNALAVDHVMPYSLWRNNDLWNLLPTHTRVNLNKSDSLPTHQLLRARRDAIVHCWSLCRDALPTRFAAEAQALAGVRNPDFGRVFDALIESVETTALQRACARWEP